MSFNTHEVAIINLIDAFISQDISAPEFEHNYLTAWRTYRDSSEDKRADLRTQRFFDTVFSLVDSYCSDPDLMDDDDLNDDDLFEAVYELQTAWRESVMV
ncbi:colicin immunity domain-containing protein [Mangrovibacter phragmitis]|uniref:colicin immunity domain-containing protein n=1 Tax=Mangrovibacter phragmitis TaxID=1691903 RepID=UPI003369F898